MGLEYMFVFYTAATTNIAPRWGLNTCLLFTLLLLLTLRPDGA
jgi:hypothetical protein